MQNYIGGIFVGWGVHQTSSMFHTSLSHVYIAKVILQKCRWKPQQHRHWLYLLYFIKYNAHASIVRTWISQQFLAKKIFLFFKYNYTRINRCKFIHHKCHLKPFLTQLPSSMYSVQGIFQHHFQCRNIRNILDKIQYLGYFRWCNTNRTHPICDTSHKVAKVTTGSISAFGSDVPEFKNSLCIS